MKHVPYRYGHLPIPGGGYVTGFLFHPAEEGLLYIRTDVGGTYRFDRAAQRWVCLIPHVTMENPAQANPISIAVDEKHPARLYVACGLRNAPTGELAVSEDYGETFAVHPMPMFVHGNLHGRGTGERLLVDRDCSDRLWFASQQDGLWRSDDRGRSWQRLAAMPETHLTFILQTDASLVVGTAGVACRGDMRGPALYVSYDGGATFTPMEQPACREVPGCRFSGLAAQRWCLTGKYLLVTFASGGARSQNVDNGYTCDSGDAMDGHVARYPRLKDGRFGPMEDVTPCAFAPAEGSALADYAPGGMLPFGFSGVAASAQTDGLVVASTIAKRDGDSIFLSRDHGASWKQLLFGLTDGDIRFRAPYMKPAYNGGRSLIHWLTELKINPFDEDECWFNTGTGVFRSFGLTRPDGYFTDWSDGVEETVHINVYSLPAGDTQVLDIVGDLGGFAFTAMDTPCENSFADEQGNRYITCLNADFADADPSRIVVTARGNWTGRTKGGLILSTDYGRTWRRLPTPFGLNDDIDDALRRIESPNTNAGWVAMSADGRHMVWSLARRVELPAAWVLHSGDGGEHFARCSITRLDGSPMTEGGFKAFADRLSPELFYGVGDHGDWYFSCDGGRSFRQQSAPEGFPAVHMAKVDCANETEIRGVPGRQGEFLVAVGEGGLWLVRHAGDRFVGERLTAPGDAVYRAGMGVGTPGGDYVSGPKAIYFNGRIGGEYGFYRTFDRCATLERINTPRQMYGRIHAIDGDCRTFGRFFLATGSYGLLYGEPTTERS